MDRPISDSGDFDFAGTGLLGPEDPAPMELHREAGASAFVLTCEHAGQAIPGKLGDLGIARADLDRHIGWDIGALEVARLMADMMDAPLVHQRYSRLVYDCNRMPGAFDAIAEHSDGTAIPANQGLSEAHATARHDEVFRPYHDAIATLLDRRQAAGLPAILGSIHSFTPVFQGEERPWHLGVLYGSDRSYPALVLEQLYREAGLVIGDNEPYAITYGKDYTIPVHGEDRGIPHVEIEIRHDLIVEAEGQARVAEVLVRVFEAAARYLPR